MSTENFVDSLLGNVFNGLTTQSTETDQQAVAEMLDKYGLRWDVKKEKLQLPDQKETQFYGIVRQDTRECFATCSDMYKEFQNSELAELLLRIADKTGYELHSGGQFNGGAKVYMQLATGNSIKDIGENHSQVKGFTTGLNGHDGSSLRWGFVNFTVCCMNTYKAAAKRLQHTARHTEGIHSKVEESLREIKGLVKVEKDIFQSFIDFSTKPVTKDNIARIVQEITDVDLTMTPAQREDKYSSKALAKTRELTDSIYKEMDQKGHTLWGLFSGVTYYTSHKAQTPKRDNARLESKYTGTLLQTDNNAYRSVLEML